MVSYLGDVGVLVRGRVFVFFLGIEKVISFGFSVRFFLEYLFWSICLLFGYLIF